MENIKEEAKNITAKQGISDMVHRLCCQHAFLTIKDNKDEFLSNPSFRLINPTKTELDKISQEILKNMSDLLRIVILANQCKYTGE